MDSQNTNPKGSREKGMVHAHIRQNATVQSKQNVLERRISQNANATEEDAADSRGG
jgi:hypothetical protein